ncbi:MAG TPA: CheR family methyltransferase [Roseiflexaceae bacterium]
MTPSRQSTALPPGAARSTWPGLLSPDEFERLRHLLAGYSGVYLDAARRQQLEHALAQRLAATGDDLAGYERRIASPDGRDELRRLAELMLNHETMFFRNGLHVRALRETLLPEIHRCKPPGEPIRIWSAGCATGEEAYSLAIVALETFGRLLARPVDIWATDLSEPALEQARAGCYRGRSLQNLSADLLRRYFQPSGDGYCVGEVARSLTRFEPQNLLDPFPLDALGVDIIFCQNVTIYFQLKTCRELIARFYECLPERGLLFLGFSETLWNISDNFRSREVAGAYVYYKETLESAAPSAEPRERRTLDPGDVRRRGTSSTRRDHQRSAGVSHDRSQVFHDHASPSRPRGPHDQETLAQGHALLDRGQFDEALKMLGHISPQSACAPQALTLAARAHADRGDLDLATAEVQRAIELDALNEEAYLLLGMIYGRQGQWPAAIQQLERARYLSAESALASFHLAEAYRQSGRADKAAREYRNTLRKLDRHPPGDLLDGVAVGWLRETCHRRIAVLPKSDIGATKGR